MLDLAFEIQNEQVKGLENDELKGHGSSDVSEVKQSRNVWYGKASAKPVLRMEECRFTVEADEPIKDLTTIVEFSGDVDYWKNRLYDDSDRYINGINHTRYAGDGIWLDRPITILPVLKSLLRTGTRILVYSGDFDYKVPYTITLEAINKLNLKQTTPWTLWSANKETGGFYIVYDKDLTFATVRAAGHEVPLSQPEKALVMIGAFLKNESLPVPNFRDFGMGTVN